MASLQHAYKLNNNPRQARLRVVEPVAKKTSKRRAKRIVVPRLATAMILAVILIISCKLYQQALTSQTYFAANQFRQKIDEQQKANHNLKYRLSLLKAPGRIQQIAVGRLGMVEGEKAGYITVPSEIEYRKAARPAPEKRDRPTMASLLSFSL